MNLRNETNNGPEGPTPVAIGGSLWNYGTRCPNKP